MKKIWVVQYGDGTADVYETPQPPPAYPYVDAFEFYARIDELQVTINNFCQEYQHITPQWREQPEIKALFDLWRKQIIDE